MGKILIVDDEPMIRNLCRAALKKSGLDSILAENGALGLETFLSQREEIDLVLADVSMPVMTGGEMVRRMLEVHPGLDVVLMTGYSDAEMLSDEIRKICKLISKPFSPRTLVETVQRCLER